MIVNVDGLIFSFPPGWDASKYDEWAFYRNQFSRMRNDIKSVDVLAIEPDATLYIIEVKDYRQHPRTKPTCLASEVASKVFDTLAALLPARVNGAVADEIALADKALSARKIRVVLHLEQPGKHSKLFPRAIKPEDVRQKLRQLLKAIDAHPVVVEKDAMRSLAWTVTDA